MTSSNQEAGRKRRRSAIGGESALTWDSSGVSGSNRSVDSDNHGLASSLRGGDSVESEESFPDGAVITAVPGFGGDTSDRRDLPRKGQHDIDRVDGEHGSESGSVADQGSPVPESGNELDETARRLARAKLKDRALGYLARREHSAHELKEKLTRKDEYGFSAEIVDELTAARLQSDARYAEHLARVRVGAGKGPMVLYREFQQHRIDAVIVESVMAEYQGQWSDLAEAARMRKFGEDSPADYKAWARQARFLQQRGFSSEHIPRRDRD